MISKLPVIIMKNAKAEILVTNGEIEDGHEKVIARYEGMVQFSHTSKRVQNTDGIWVALAGKVYSDVEFCDGFEFSGLIKINNSNYYHFSGRKLFNPDGTFHHLELEVNA